jgi:hypothetical protein
MERVDMVAFNFEKRFVNSIRKGLGLPPLEDFPPAVSFKRHTIRARRERGEPKEGDALQLYFGQRTQHCILIGRTVCIGISPLTLMFDDDDESEGVVSPGFGIGQWGYATLDEFAQGDGFPNWRAFRHYWRSEREVTEFEGSIVFWQTKTQRGRK